MLEERFNHPLHAAIDDKLAEIAASSPTTPSWYSLVAFESANHGRLAIYCASARRLRP